MAHDSITPLAAALSSHKPSGFSHEPKSDKPEMEVAAMAANSLQFRCNYNLRSESARGEPRLRRLLGHISIYDAVRDWRETTELDDRSTTAAEDDDTTPSSTRSGCKSTAPRHSHARCVSDFQTALQQHIYCLGQVRAAHAHLMQMSRDYGDADEEAEEGRRSDDGFETGYLAVFDQDSYEEADNTFFFDSDSDLESESDSDCNGDDQAWRDEEEEPTSDQADSDCTSASKSSHQAAPCLATTEETAGRPPV